MGLGSRSRSPSPSARAGALLQVPAQSRGARYSCSGLSSPISTLLFSGVFLVSVPTRKKRSTWYSKTKASNRRHLTGHLLRPNDYLSTISVGIGERLLRPINRGPLLRSLSVRSIATSHPPDHEAHLSEPRRYGTQCLHPAVHLRHLLRSYRILSLVIRFCCLYYVGRHRPNRIIR